MGRVKESVYTAIAVGLLSGLSAVALLWGFNIYDRATTRRDPDLGGDSGVGLNLLNIGVSGVVVGAAIDPNDPKIKELHAEFQYWNKRMNDYLRAFAEANRKGMTESANYFYKAYDFAATKVWEIEEALLKIKRL